jgi:hypothetical protein
VLFTPAEAGSGVSRDHVAIDDRHETARHVYFLKFWLMKQIGVQWNHYEYYFGHLLMRYRSKWTNDPEDKKMLDALYNPDRATFDKLVAEKDEVIRQAKLSVADMEAAVPFLTPAQANSLWKVSGSTWMPPSSCTPGRERISPSGCLS